MKQLLTNFNRSGRLLQHTKRNGFIYFKENGWVSFIEIHRDVVSFTSVPFDIAIDGLIEGCVVRYENNVPVYDFYEQWGNIRNTSLEELRNVIASCLF